MGHGVDLGVGANRMGMTGFIAREYRRRIARRGLMKTYVCRKMASRFGLGKMGSNDAASAEDNRIESTFVESEIRGCVGFQTA